MTQSVIKSDEPRAVGFTDVALTDFLDSMFDGVAVIGPDLRFRYFNDSLRTMLSLGTDEIAVGVHLRDILTTLAERDDLGPRHGRTVREIVEARVDAWGTDDNLVERRELNDGRVIDIFRTLTIAGDTVAIHVDVTDSVRSAEVAERQRQVLISLIENTTDGFVLLGPDGRMELFNNRVLELYDVDPESVYWGMEYDAFAQQLRDVADLPRHERDSMLRERREFAFNPDATQARRELATGRTLNINKRTLANGGCVMTIRDVTAELNREQELIDARIRAEESNRHKSEFVARMSHEMRTPLNGVLGVAALLQNSEMGLRERELVNVISASGKVLLRLIDDILDLSKLDAETFKMVDDDLRVADLVSECIATIRPAAAEKDLEIRLLEPNVHTPVVRGDAVRIKQVLLNLLTNAVKFTERGYVEVEYHHKVGADGVTLVFSISDTGVGIDEDKLDQIFNRFYQIDGTVTRRYGGAGLGLSITKKLVETMGGTIQVASEKGKGTTFHIRLTLPTAKMAVQTI